MHYQKYDVDKILNSLDFENFYQKYVPGFNTNGKKQVKVNCVFHEDTTPSLSINLETGLWNCFGCDKHGNAIQFVQKLFDLNFPEACERVITDHNLFTKTNKKIEKKSTAKIPRYLNLEQIKAIHGQLLKTPDALKKIQIKYGLSIETIKKYLIGYQNKHFMIPAEIEPGKWLFKEHKGQQSKGAKACIYPGEIIDKKLPHIIICEGELKALLLNQLEFPAVCGTAGAGTWKEEWNALFREMNVILAFDNDAPGKRGSRKVAESLRGTAKNIKVIAWPADLDGSTEKKDITDFFIVLKKTQEDFQKLIDNAQEVVEDQKLNTKEYFVDKDGYSRRMKTTRDGKVPVRLANFNAIIEKEIIEDDGIEQKRKYILKGKIENRKNLPTIEVNASSFSAMSWLHQWGTHAVIEPGQTVKDFLRYFIQISSQPQTETVYSHTGWREVDGEWIFLTAVGAIGKDNVSTKLPRELQKYSLPLAVGNEKEALEASLSFLDLGNKAVTFPLFFLAYLAPLTTFLDPQPNFSGYIYGETGTRKTTLALLLLSHFGNFRSIHQLSNFESTANLLARRAFTLKDMLMVIDDYHPTIQEREAQLKESILQRIIRSASNRTDRGRLNSDSTEKGCYEPRGMILSTGEDLPTLQSTLARMLVVEISKEDISLKKLTELQKKAYLLPHAMTSYILFLKKNLSKIQDLFCETFIKLREKASAADMHGKLSEQIAFLYFTLEVVTAWAVEKRVIDYQKSVDFKTAGWKIFTGLSNSQEKRFQRENPVRMFIDILETLINQGKVFLENKENPFELPLLGQLKGDFIGCYDEDYLYIIPPALWNVVQRFCRQEGTHFPVTKNTLYRLLKIRGLIETKESANTVSVWFKNKAIKVIKFYRAHIHNFEGKGGKD
ncbi:MAG: DUF927 domain-containing protein [Nitrospirae bacterium]|nr:DUF927 domain-containing protein [Nitrospirota bacterium]